MGHKNLFIRIRNLVLLRGKRQGIEETQASDMARYKILERTPYNMEDRFEEKGLEAGDTFLEVTSLKEIKLVLTIKRRNRCHVTPPNDKCPLITPLLILVSVFLLRLSLLLGG